MTLQPNISFGNLVKLWIQLCINFDERVHFFYGENWLINHQIYAKQQSAAALVDVVTFSKTPNRFTWHTAEITRVTTFLALLETLIFPS
jgi:hypothetical protein